MCYDQEKTQAPADPRIPDFIRREMRDKQAAFENQIGGASVGCEMSPKHVLEELFSYHPPTPHTLPKFQAINQAAKNFAEIVLQNCPHGADRSITINAIRKARMFANAAISLNGLSL
jgi:hypothetical protein